MSSIHETSFFIKDFKKDLKRNEKISLGKKIVKINPFITEKEREKEKEFRWNPF